MITARNGRPKRRKGRLAITALYLAAKVLLSAAVRNFFWGKAGILTVVGGLGNAVGVEGCWSRSWW